MMKKTRRKYLCVAGLLVFLLAFIMAYSSPLLATILAGLLAMYFIVKRERPTEFLIKVSKFSIAYLFMCPKARRRIWQITPKMKSFFAKFELNHRPISVAVEPWIKSAKEGVYKFGQLIFIQVSCIGGSITVVVRIVLLYVGTALALDPRRVASDCISCLSFFLTETFFTEMEMEQHFDVLHDEFFNEYVISKKKKTCFKMLQTIREGGLLKTLLTEIRHSKRVEETRRIVKFIFAIANKKRGTDVELTISNKCSFILVGKPNTRVNLDAYMRRIDIAIATDHVKRVYITGYGHINMLHIRRLGQLLGYDRRLEKMFEDEYTREGRYPAMVLGYRKK